MRSFGQILRILLQKRNMTVKALAQETQIPLSSVYDWLDSKNRAPRDLNQIKVLASFFDISVHELLFGEPDPKSGKIPDHGDFEISNGIYEVSVRKLSGQPTTTVIKFKQSSLSK